MTRAFEDVTRRSLALVTAMLGATLAIALVPNTADASGTALAVLALLLAAVAGHRFRRVAFAADVAASAAPPDRDAPERVLRARVTDPVHHPLRPRAPGLT